MKITQRNTGIRGRTVKSGDRRWENQNADMGQGAGRITPTAFEGYGKSRRRPKPPGQGEYEKWSRNPEKEQEEKVWQMWQNDICERVTATHAKVKRLEVDVEDMRTKTGEKDSRMVEMEDMRVRIEEIRLDIATLFSNTNKTDEQVAEN